MRLKPSSRIPLLLLACLGVTLMFPRACAGTRAGLGGLIFGTAGLSAGVTAQAPTPADDALREELARLRSRISRLEAERSAVPQGPVGELPGVTVETRPAAELESGLVAHVLHRDAARSRRSFVIGVGSDDGVETGMPVLAGHSLVGVVEAVAGHACTVLRVDDISPVCRFPAVVLPVGSSPAAVLEPDPEGRPTAHGVCQGKGDGGLVVSFLAEGDARPGDLVVTRSQCYPFPAGLVLGEVESFDDTDRRGDWEAVVRPLRDLDALETVFVLKRAPLPRQLRPK